MRILTVPEAEGQLTRLIAEVNEVELIVLKDGDNEVTLYPGGALDLGEDLLAIPNGAGGTYEISI